MKRLFGRKWPPLTCKPADLADLMAESIAEGAPVCNLIVACGGAEHRMGVSSDYSESRGFFDTGIYLDGEQYATVEEFCAKGRVDGVPFMEWETVNVLEETDLGDPRNLTLLAKRAL